MSYEGCLIFFNELFGRNECHFYLCHPKKNVGNAGIASLHKIKILIRNETP